MDSIPENTSSTTSTTSSTSSTNLKLTKTNENGRINIDKRFGDPSLLFSVPTSTKMSEFEEQLPSHGKIKNCKPADWFHLLSRRQESLNINESNVINEMFSDSIIGYNEFKSILNKLSSERCNSVCNDFIEFIISCSSELDYLLNYNDTIKNMMYNSVFGVIFCLFSNVNNLHYNNDRNIIQKKITSTILQPELVCLFTCCGRPVFPSHKCYEDAKCKVCSKTFELKDPGKFNLENFKHIENKAIHGGNVSESKFNDLQDNQTKPTLLLKLRLRGDEFKNPYMVPPENYEVIKPQNYLNQNGTFKTNIIIKNIEDSHRQEQINDKITEISGIKNAIKNNLLETDGTTLVDNIDKILYNLKRVLIERLRNDYDNIDDIYKKSLIDLRINELVDYHLNTSNLLSGIIKCMENSTENSTRRTIYSKYYKNFKGRNFNNRNNFRSNFRASCRNKRNEK